MKNFGFYEMNFSIEEKDRISLYKSNLDLFLEFKNLIKTTLRNTYILLLNNELGA